jgi:hypothetical protein
MNPFHASWILVFFIDCHWERNDQEAIDCLLAHLLPGICLVESTYCNLASFWVSLKHHGCCGVVHYFEAFLESLLQTHGECWLPVAATNGCRKWTHIGCCLHVKSPRGPWIFCAAVVVLFLCATVISRVWISKVTIKTSPLFKEFCFNVRQH